MYLFNNNEYNNLNDLALAYKDFFEFGIDDIYNNTKKFLKFVKKNTKDKTLVKRLVDYITYSKYKNNALTFVIFELLDNKEVVINGKSMDFMQFLSLLKFSDKKEDNALIAFMEDHGITTCFEKLVNDPKLMKDMYYVELAYNSDMAYKYLTTLTTYEIKEQPDKKLISISIENEECFKHAANYVRTDDFILSVAHKFGFKEAYKIYKEANPVFYSLQCFKKDIEDSDLRRIISDTYYWWLKENYDKYIATSVNAKRLMNKIDKMAKEYNNYSNKKKKKQIADISYDLYSDISRNFYLCYIDFVYYFRKGEIKVNKKKYEESKYLFDKPYMFTYITEDFMKNHIVKLAEGKAASEEKINPLTGEVIEAAHDAEVINNDIEIDENKYLDEKPESRKLLKSYNKRIRGGFLFAFIATAFLGVHLAAFAFLKTGFSGEFFLEQLLNAYNNPLLMFGGIATAALMLIFSIIFIIISEKRRHMLETYISYIDMNNSDYHTREEEYEISKISKDVSLIRKKVLKKDSLFNILCISLFGATSIVVGIFGAIALTYLLRDGSLLHYDFNESFKKSADLYLIITYAIGAIVGIISSFGFKNKLAALIFTLLISIIGALVLVFIF